jgi:hypothetical protein
MVACLRDTEKGVTESTIILAINGQVVHTDKSVKFMQYQHASVGACDLVKQIENQGDWNDE